ncbi:MAG: tRNA (adenosine(37)-N6)-dimethylallyltransferase MiaA [Clostridia bacterium]|nr:tRNA (adenosine(37)-N6)-dimethylallyltransferase MiaA [Clostridia bacterium]
MQNKIPLVILCGATASGKTALGIKLAKEFCGEVISCDSMQIYKNLSIGTAKPTKEEMDGIIHHMIDVADPREDFSVEKYCTMAHDAILRVHKKGKLPIMVGGTGLYADNTVFCTTFSAPKRDAALSEELSLFAKKNGNTALFEILKKEDPLAAQKLHPNDVKRVIRAIETKRTTGKTRLELDSISRPEESPYDYIYLAIDMDRDLLYKRIDTRVDIMLENGLLNEVRTYILPSLSHMSTAAMAIGYREVIWYFKGLCTYSEMTGLLKRNTRRYAKRQLTWFRKNSEMNWLDYNDAFNQAKDLINSHFNKRKDFDK